MVASLEREPNIELRVKARKLKRALPYEALMGNPRAHRDEHPHSTNHGHCFL
jgi:hypothetical protein